MNELLYEYYKELLSVESNNENAVVCRYLSGEKYKSSPVRLLVIGRAINGWHSDFVTRDIDKFRELWEKQENEGLECLTHRSSDGGKTKATTESIKGLEWIETSIKKNDKWYLTAESKFWKVIKKTALSLLCLDNEKEWTKYIAWTNLAKLAPLLKDNPTAIQWKHQEEIVPRILEEELKILNPTHILIIAKKEEDSSPQEDSWTSPFYDVLEKYKKSKECVKIAYMHRPDSRKKGSTINAFIEKIREEFGISNN